MLQKSLLWKGKDSLLPNTKLSMPNNTCTAQFSQEFQEKLVAIFLAHVKISLLECKINFMKLNKSKQTKN